MIGNFYICILLLFLMEKREIVLYGIIVVLAIISRFAFLDLRILHHDEGVNYFFANEILESGRFIYDPLNYHGPFYFFALALSFLIFGISEFSLRFPAVIFGILIVILPLFFNRKEFGRYIVPVFLLISPSLMYYSRYSIHEGAFVLFSLLSVYFFSLILEKKNLKYLPYFVIALALLFTIKETVVIMLFIIFIISIINYKRIREIDFKESLNIILVSLFIFIFIFILLFTSFFFNINGLGDSLRAFSPWIDRGLNEIGHDKSFYYYSLILLEYELPILLFALIGVIYTFKFRKNVFVLNFSLWMILSFLIYSFIPYKTPWLIINIVAPMCFIACFGFKNIKFKYKWIFLLISIFYLISVLLYVNFGFPWQEENKYAYVHTDIDILRLVDRVNNYEEPQILIVSKEYWPLPFYFHEKKVDYLDNGFEGYGNYSDYNLFIFNAPDFVEEELPIGYEHNKYKLRPGVELVLVEKA